MCIRDRYNAIVNSDQGNVEGIVGTPLDITDTKYSVKQKYNSEIDAFVPTYYYWVKNRTDLPVNSVVERKNSTAYVKNVIENPKGMGMKYYTVSDSNKLLLWNVSKLKGSNIVLNFDTKTNDHEGDAHSVWKLVKEGDSNYRPGTQIETRWWDSLIGQNTEGDLVPDLDLTVN